MRNGAWHETQSVSSCAAVSKLATTVRGSMATAEIRSCAMRSGTRCAAPANAASGSPALIARRKERLPSTSAKRTAAPLASAASGGAAADSSSYSTESSSAASHAALALSAAIATTGTPTACTTPSAMIGCGGTFMSGMARFTGMGPRCRTWSPVTTATTPGAVRTASTSRRVMRA